MGCNLMVVVKNRERKIIPLIKELTCLATGCSTSSICLGGMGGEFRSRMRGECLGVSLLRMALNLELFFSDLCLLLLLTAAGLRHLCPAFILGENKIRNIK